MASVWAGLCYIETMMLLLSFALITADPAPLLGGPEDVRATQEAGEVIYVHEEQAYRAEGSYERYRHERSRTNIPHDSAFASQRPVQAGDPVSLDDGFFQGPLTGGVGGQPPRIVVVQQHGHSYSRWR
ncbi:hypothetical protein ACFELO_13465 [Oceanicaulis sp. LC35]|uniref:hypothetical protein n=1 Tax=Oceanicaulis sp. LC35 TaxID=3349635 RepID=UPI003F847E2A